MPRTAIITEIVADARGTDQRKLKVEVKMISCDKSCPFVPGVYRTD
jgi:hypothetical protein